MYMYTHKSLLKNEIVTMVVHLVFTILVLIKKQGTSKNKLTV